MKEEIKILIKIQSYCKTNLRTNCWLQY